MEAGSASKAQNRQLVPPISLTAIYEGEKFVFKFIEYLFEYISTQFPHLPLYSKER
jgi:hypothetical protein